MPHFATGEKFRVVFDCAARFCGVSLNGLLLQGPDLTNNLVGVLLRFRQEPVTFAVDIKAMFHQVCVAEPDREALHFLWWPGNDMTQPPVDYAVNVFIFGATCSPSCATFAFEKLLRTTSQVPATMLCIPFLIIFMLTICWKVSDRLRKPVHWFLGFAPLREWRLSCNQIFVQQARGAQFCSWGWPGICDPWPELGWPRNNEGTRCLLEHE